MEVILLERVAKLGQMGDVVRVQRRLCPQFPAAAGQGAARHRRQQGQVRGHEGRAAGQATSTPRARPARSRAKLDGKSFTVLRQASETGQLYGSVSPRDLADLLTDGGFEVDRNQIALNVPIKTIGQHKVPVLLHPEVEVTITRQRRAQRRRGRAARPRRERHRPPRGRRRRGARPRPRRPRPKRSSSRTQPMPKAKREAATPRPRRSRPSRSRGPKARPAEKADSPGAVLVEDVELRRRRRGGGGGCRRRAGGRLQPPAADDRLGAGGCGSARPAAWRQAQRRRRPRRARAGGFVAGCGWPACGLARPAWPAVRRRRAAGRARRARRGLVARRARLRRRRPAGTPTR